MEIEEKKDQYVILIHKLIESEGGGFIADIKNCYPGTYTGCGETPQEALKSLYDVCKEIHNDYFLNPDKSLPGHPQEIKQFITNYIRESA